LPIGKRLFAIGNGESLCGLEFQGGMGEMWLLAIGNGGKFRNKSWYVFISKLA